MIKAHIIKLYPNKSQELLIRKSCGIARYSYNWALAKWKELYESGEKPSAYSLIKLQNSIKRIEMPFFMEVSKTAPQYAIHDLQAAFTKFFKGIAKYPKFKKKGTKDSFIAVENKEQFRQKDFKIKLPRIGWVKCAENLRFEGKVNNVTVKRNANNWFAIINIEQPDATPALKQSMGDNQAIVGIDIGIKTLMVISDGTVYENPKALRKNLKRLKRMQRGLSRKQKGGNNRQKQKNRVARLHYRISCIRKNAIHQATTEIVRKYGRIVIEDLYVKGMLKNDKLAQSVADCSFGEIRRQLTYKAKWNCKELVVADRWFASSKTCSYCGVKKKILKLSERTFKCDNCGKEIDRDLNAAINLANYGTTGKLSESYASGFGSSVSEMMHSPKMKEEINNNIICCQNQQSRLKL